MIERVTDSLNRQHKALLLLKTLLEEEFSRLTDLEPQTVSSIELSVQELLRQLGRERMLVRGLVGDIQPGAQRVRELADVVDEDRMARMQDLLAEMDDMEQACARQAAKNQALVLGLYDQSTGLLQVLHDAVQPKSKAAYAKTGRFAQVRPEASLIRGRL